VRSDPVVADLLAALPSDRVLLDADAVTPYLRDAATWGEHGRARAVVRARDTSEVAATVAVCARHRIPLVPRGAGTGLAGGANAVDGGVVLSTDLMREIVEINAAERLAVVQPGVVNDDLRAAAAERLLWYPPDHRVRGGRSAGRGHVIRSDRSGRAAVSGEHGVGLLKRAGLRRELDPGALALHRAVKQAFDPQGILWRSRRE
jgi:FAD/FMN-containing dehydrogenase